MGRDGASDSDPEREAVGGGRDDGTGGLVGDDIGMLFFTAGGRGSALVRISTCVIILSAALDASYTAMISRLSAFASSLSSSRLSASRGLSPYTADRRSSFTYVTSAVTTMYIETLGTESIIFFVIIVLYLRPDGTVSAQYLHNLTAQLVRATCHHISATTTAR